MTPTDIEILRAIKHKVRLEDVRKHLPGLEESRLDSFYTRLENSLSSGDNGETVTINVDGASDSEDNAGIGILLTSAGGKEIARLSRGIGKATNNVAEYMAVIEGLKLAEEKGFSAVIVLSDSELVVKQINGDYRVKSEHLLPLYKKAVITLARFDSWEVNHVGRTENVTADRLAKSGAKMPLST